MKKMSYRKMWLLLAFACLSAESQAQMSGSGTENDPYLVKTPDDLFDIRNDLSACYKMANDIDLTEWIAEENPTNGWAPIDGFAGTFDGGGHIIRGLYVNRPNEEFCGLFGTNFKYSGSPTFKNIIFINPIVVSDYYAGALAGHYSGSVTNVKVIGGNISSYWAGGIVGYGNGMTFRNNVVIHSQIKALGDNRSWAGGITGNVSKACIDNVVIECDMEGIYVGGIGGRTLDGAAYTGNYVSSIVKGSYECDGIAPSYSSENITYQNNRFDGKIYGGDVAGIMSETGTVKNNIVMGTISGSGNVYGVSPATAAGNVCCADSIITTSASSSIARIGYSGTNYAYNGMVVMKNGVPQTVNDGGINGTSYSLRMLRRKSTYTALGFDFNNDWAIVEGVTLPYNKQQSTPATIEKCFGGENCIVSGTATGNGTVYVFVDGKMTTGEVTDGRWSVSIGNIAVGTTVKVSVETEGMLPSIITKTSAADPSGDTTEQCATPTISYTDGVLHFDCATEGVTYHYMVTNGAVAEQIGNDNELSSTYMVSVYATKEGYYDSEVATKEINLAGLKGDINGDGEVTPMDASLILQYIAKKITW